MDVTHVSDYLGGWFLGNFTPTIEANPHVEICVKRYPKGAVEPVHYQRQANEYTIILSGRARMGDFELLPDDIIRIPPGEACDFEALEDTVLVAVKTPSLSDDKVIGEPE